MQVRGDVFPAYATVTPADVEIELSDIRSSPPSTGSFQIPIARVVISGNRVIIARDGAQGPSVVFSEEIDPTTYFKNPNSREDSYVQTLSGKKIAFKKDSACGCGSRLRSWNPYKNTLNSINDPTE